MPSASSPPQVDALHDQGRFDGRAGATIAWQAWIPPTPRAVLVVAHGAAEHGGRYRYVVERVVPEGFAVYAIDHRGHGRSTGKRAQIDRMAHVVADLDGLVTEVERRHPGLPRFLLGHSMGGSVALEYALRHQDRLAGLVLSAPLAVLEAPAAQRAAVRLLSRLAPGAGVHQVDATRVSRDAGEVRAYREDPLNHVGRLPARSVHELVETTARLPEAVPRITLPLLVLLPTADTVVDPAGGRMVHDRAGSSDKTLRSYEGYFHESFNEAPEHRARPLDDLADWLSARV